MTALVYNLRRALNIPLNLVEAHLVAPQVLEEQYGPNTPEYLREIEALVARCHLSILGPPPQAA